MFWVWYQTCYYSAHIDNHISFSSSFEAVNFQSFQSIFIANYTGRHFQADVILINLCCTLSKSGIFLVSVRLHRGLQYSVWLTTRVFSNVSIGCRALVLNVLSTHPAIRCPVAAVFLICMSNLALDAMSKVSDSVFLFNQNPGWGMVYGFVFCFTNLMSSNLSSL